jgi:peptidoglycan/LPS O-acetylase OafA/YrhL
MGAGFGWWSLGIAFSSAFMLAYFLFVALFAYGSFLCLERPAQSWIRRRLLARTKPADLIAAP